MKHVKELIESLPGVEFVHIVENHTYGDDKKTGLPPHSFKVYVLGGNKKQIATLIYAHQSVGVTSIGNTAVKIKDFMGLKHYICFERLL